MTPNEGDAGLVALLREASAWIGAENEELRDRLEEAALRRPAQAPAEPGPTIADHAAFLAGRQKP